MSNNNENRVLIRRGARELTEQEVDAVTGAFQRRTLTPCSVDPHKKLLFAGDTSECGDV